MIETILAALAAVESFKTQITAYNPGDLAQTDLTPCIAASGQNICNRDENICASNRFELGTVIYIQDFGRCKVLDRMNSRFTNRVDIAFDSYQKAKSFGVQTRKIYYVER